MTHVKKEIKNGKYPSYTFKLDPKTVAALDALQAKEELSWNLLFIKMMQKYEKTKENN